MKPADHIPDDGEEKQADALEVGEGARHDVAPIEKLSRAVRADVSRLRQVWHTVRTPFEMVGLGFVTIAGAIGVSTVVVVGFHDWYMHLGMHLVMLALALLYLRAHVRGRKYRRAGYAAVTAALFLFFAWALVDLVPPRLEIVGDTVSADGGVVPNVMLRGAADALKVAAGFLVAGAAWVVLHWAILSRRVVAS